MLESLKLSMSATQRQIKVTINFYSFFKDLTGCAAWEHSVPHSTALSQFLPMVIARFPKLEPVQKSMLVAVGVEYQERSYILKDGDEVSLFPPVQGG